MTFLDDVKAAAEAPRPSKTVEVSLNGNTHMLTFYRADGDDWADCVARHPVRIDEDGNMPVIDKKFGYNFNAVVLDIGATTARVGENGAEIPPEVWGQFIRTLSGHEIGKIADAVWALNELDPMLELAQAKKASKRTPVSRRKSA